MKTKTFEEFSQWWCQGFGSGDVQPIRTKMKTKTKQIDSNRPIKSGDIVVLKSGGPQMTVEHVSEVENRQGLFSVHCEWMSGTIVYRHEFPSVCLRLSMRDPMIVHGH